MPKYNLAASMHDIERCLEPVFRDLERVRVEGRAEAAVDLATTRYALVRAAEDADSHFVALRSDWSASNSYDARQQALAVWNSRHPIWEAELAQLTGYLAGGQFRRAVRASKKAIDRSAGKRIRPPSLLMDTSRPLSELAKRIETPTEWENRTGRRIRTKRGSKRYAMAQRHHVLLLVVAVFDCISTSEYIEQEVSSRFSISFALAVGGEQVRGRSWVG